MNRVLEINTIFNINYSETQERLCPTKVVANTWGLNFTEEDFERGFVYLNVRTQLCNMIRTLKKDLEYNEYYDRYDSLNNIFTFTHLFQKDDVSLPELIKFIVNNNDRVPIQSIEFSLNTNIYYKDLDSGHLTRINEPNEFKMSVNLNFIFNSQFDRDKEVAQCVNKLFSDFERNENLVQYLMNLHTRELKGGKA